MKKYQKIIIFSCICLLLLRWAASFSTSITEAIYSRGVYLLIRPVLDYTIGSLPFPLLYIVLPGLIVWTIYGVIKLFKSEQKVILRIKKSGLHTLTTLAMAIGLFLLLWGFNYGRIPIEEQIGISPNPVLAADLEKDFNTVALRIIEDKEKIKVDTEVLSQRVFTQPFKKEILELVQQQMKAFGYPAYFRPRLRLLRPKGILLRISTAGFYSPWTGECHVDGGMHPLQIPFVMAHEYSHAFGITDEGSCNFIAYLACKNSADPFIRYSGRLGYWRYLRSGLARAKPEVYRNFMKDLDVEVKKDLQEIRKYLDRYPDIFPKARDLAYDTYLKTQGINEGLKNYSRVVMLVAAYERQKKK